jgi:hypothetical protein
MRAFIVASVVVLAAGRQVRAWVRSPGGKGGAPALAHGCPGDRLALMR